MASLNTRPTVAVTAAVPPMTLLVRFLHIGSDKCSFNKFDPEISMENIETRLECIISMGRARASLPISTIRKVYQSKCLLRTNETMFALAYCARQNHSLELRTLAYQEALTLIDNQADFLMFLKYCVRIKMAMNVNNGSRKGFGKAMRKFVSKWYGKYTNVELADMFGEQRGLYKWTHKDVISLAHLNPKISHPPNGVAPSTPSVATTASASQSNTVTATTSNTTGSTASNEMPPEVLADRERVLQFNFKNGQDYLKYLNGLDQPLGEGALRMKALQQLKTNESTPDAVSKITENRFNLNQMPAALLERIEIWDVLLPHLTFRQLLDKLYTLKDLGFLNPDRRFAKKYVKALNNPNKCNAENPRICPIYVFIMKRMYEKNERYLAKTKKMHYEKKMEKRGVQINDAVTNQLSLLVEHTAAHGKRAPANYFIAMDLRAKNATKHVLRNEFIYCNEAMVLLAYSILKREKNALLYQYTDDKDVMKALKLPTTSFEAAKTYCEEKEMSRTHQSLELPLSVATNLKKKIDVFVVITESVARFCRQGQAPVNEFLAYKQKFNKTAKYVVVNLSRSKPDLLTSSEVDSKGFFEIVGFNENTPKLLYALGKGAFS